MKAAVLHGREDVRVEEVVPRALKSGELRVRVETALTCGTDLKVFRRGYHAKMIVPPAVFGHELAGVVAEVHPETPGWSIGDRVVAANSAPCGHCDRCRCGQENLCNDLLFLNGAYAQSIVVPERIVQKNLIRLQPGTESRSAALTEPLACVVQGLDDVALNGGEHLLVIGSGPIGLMFVALAKHIGCTVSVVGRGENRLNTARRLGAAHVFGSGTDEELARQFAAASLPLFDVVVEAVGKPETWELAVRLVRPGGKVNLFGGCPAGSTVTFDPSRIHYSSIRFCSSFHHTPQTIRRALEYIETGIIRADDFVDGEAPLSELPVLLRRMVEGNRAVKTAIRVDE